mmetsp:Transcript_9334/g.34218  ORF Transcript_9334/g.34218 Transcript_9334/m.34218 type:complete len:805 (+) Transcript_9334:675-3089(+)|eukprot:scaffold1929_cov376-Prasinococcus_capsulatus_cf.AAC.29
MGTPGQGVPKVTDMLYSLVSQAEARNTQYEETLDALLEKHVEAAEALLEDGERLESIKSQLETDINNLRAMLKAMYIAGASTSTFSDFVVGHGELWNARLTAAVAAQRSTDRKVAFLDAREVLIARDAEDKNNVDVLYELSEQKLTEWLLSNGKPEVIVATGFIATTPDGLPTTLKRDGSDFSATIFGALVRAGLVTIWTDVNGVFSADPRKVTDAVVLGQLTYEEAWELSYFGASVLHPRTTLPAMKYEIPIKIRNFFNTEHSGTVVCVNGQCLGPPVPSITKQYVKGFATIDNLALINVEGTGMVGVPGTAGSIFNAVKEAEVNVIMISQASSEHSICFAVPGAEADKAVNAVKECFKKSIAMGRIRTIEKIENQSVLAAVGSGMAKECGVASIMMSALAKANVNIRAIAQGCSENNITVVIDQNDSVKALKAVHSRFYLSDTTMAVGVVGPGLIGKTLMAQLKEQTSFLDSEFNIQLRVMGICNSRTMLVDDRGIDLDTWEAEFESKGKPLDPDEFSQHVNSSNVPNAVMLDLTASDVVAAQYEGWLKQGIHVVTPNKKANSGDLAYYQRLRDLQRESYTHYFYEATVGAGLPILSTLKGLLETGDKVTRIEGIFSGTLSYIFNTYTPDQNFSDVVKVAKELGYTEPDPREDLSGMDVARKVTILARESGLGLELSEVPVRSLVPEPLQEVDSVDEFMSRLPDFDADIKAEAQAAAKEGKVLRYVGVVDAAAGTGSVELRKYDASHPFAQLKGSDNIISFQTDRYDSQPLIVRGPGAGPEVTAGGVFCDILRLAAYLGAPS